jgi:hypothetical protein
LHGELAWDGTIIYRPFIVPVVVTPKYICLCRVTQYKKASVQLRGAAERIVQQRKKKGVREEDTDLLAFMLRQQAAGSSVLTDKQIVDEVLLSPNASNGLPLPACVYRLPCYHLHVHIFCGLSGPACAGARVARVLPCACTELCVACVLPCGMYKRLGLGAMFCHVHVKMFVRLVFCLVACTKGWGYSCFVMCMGNCLWGSMC